jgi:UDP-N-acetylglucosamine 2-epimerase (non-hydrolysing)
VRRVAVVVGTRPEAIKLAPVVQALRRQDDLETRLVATAQHREMLDQALAVFGLAPDVDLDLMRPGQGLAELTARLLTGLAETFAAERPDLVLVQGDTTTVLTAAMAAFYERIPVGHVEAGLRSGDRYDPFPEEANRRLAGVLASLHFAPTERARRHLLAEGVPAERVVLTGNTVIDALQHVVGRLPPLPPPDGRRLLLLTAHRRENWGEPIRRVCRAVRDVLDARPDVALVFPVHRNPVVRDVVWAELGGHPRIELREPADYAAMVDLERRCYLALTDSGGLQEELPSLGKPVLVLRETTERPEAVEAGCARLIGTAREAVAAHLLELLDDRRAYAAMAQVANPFGDGRASERIVAAIRDFLGIKGA